MTKPFAELETRMSPEARARSDALHRELADELLQSVRQMDDIAVGKRPPSRTFLVEPQTDQANADDQGTDAGAAQGEIERGPTRDP